MSTESQAQGTRYMPMPKFDVTRYVPDGGVEPVGFFIIVAVMAAAGAVLGFIAHFISQYVYLIIAFPLLIGLGVGTVGVYMVKFGRLRNEWLGGAAGFLAGVLAMLMMHYFDFLTLRSTLIEMDEDLAEFVNSTPAEQEEWIAELRDPEEQQALRDIAQSTSGFWGYMDYSATEGVELQRVGRGGKGLNLGYYGSWIYWLVEMVIVGGVTFVLVRRTTAMPYCRQCNTWKVDLPLGGLQGDARVAVAALESGDLERLRSAGPSPEVRELSLIAACCDECAKSGSGTVDVRIERLTTDDKGNSKWTRLTHMTYPQAALPSLAAIFGKQPGAPTKS